MAPDSSRPQALTAETIADTLRGFVQETGRLVRLQSDLLNAASGMLSDERSSIVSGALGEATNMNVREFNNVIGALASCGFGIGVRDTNNQLLPVEKLKFDNEVKKYSLECAWQNETHALVFDDSISFAILKARTRQNTSNSSHVA